VAGAADPPVVGEGVEQEQVGAGPLVGPDQRALEADAGPHVQHLHHGQLARHGRVQRRHRRGQLVGVQLHPPDSRQPKHRAQRPGVLGEGHQHRLEPARPRGGGQRRGVGQGQLGVPAGNAVPQTDEVRAGRGEQGDVRRGRRPAHLEHRRAGAVLDHRPSPNIDATRLYWISVEPE
jgi:hypothetical protein